MAGFKQGYLNTINPNFVIFWKAFQQKMLHFMYFWYILENRSAKILHFMHFWYILWQFGIFVYVHMAYHFQFDMLHHEKSGNPGFEH
jgi:hypothetical protein